MSNKEKALNLVRMYNFAMIEANLFLDSHPKDQQALEYFQRMKKMHEKAVREYTEKYGPLTVSDVDASAKTWEWVKGPWPWEVDA